MGATMARRRVADEKMRKEKQRKEAAKLKEDEDKKLKKKG